MFVVYVIKTNGEADYYYQESGGFIFLISDLDEAKEFPTITIAQAKAAQLMERGDVSYAEGVYVEC